MLSWTNVTFSLLVDLFIRQSATNTSVIVYRNLKFSVGTIHGAVLALTASVLSVPYDMPRYPLCFSMHGGCRYYSLYMESGRALPCPVCVVDIVDFCTICTHT
jgi:hypothetical protein